VRSSGEIYFEYYDGSSFVGFTSSGAGITIGGGYFHVVAVLEDLASNNIDIYVNGTNVLSTTTTSDPAINSAILEISNTQPSRQFDGLIDDIAIWDENLSADEVKCLLDVGSSGDLGYDADEFDDLKQVHDAGSGSVTIGALQWTYSSTLTASAGLSGSDPNFTIVFDDGPGAGSRTGLTSASASSTVAYYRFEDTPGFLLDSSGNGNTLGNTGPAIQSALTGTDIPTTVPQTGTANAEALSFPSGSGTTQPQTTAAGLLFGGDFTIEAFVHPTVFGGQYASTIVSTHNDPTFTAGFSMTIRHDGESGAAVHEHFSFIADGGGTVFHPSGSTFVLETNKSYYTALVFDSGNSITFYLKNLTDSGPLLSETIATTQTMAAGDKFRIGSVNGDSHHQFQGYIDEVRLSDSALPESELLVGSAAAADAGTVIVLK